MKWVGYKTDMSHSLKFAKATARSCVISVCVEKAIQFYDDLMPRSRVSISNEVVRIYFF